MVGIGEPDLRQCPGNARFPLMRQIAFLQLPSPLGADVLGIPHINADIGTVRAVLVEEAIRQFAAAL